MFRRLVNRNNCVQKLRGTLIVTWQANRIDTALPAAPAPAFTPGPVRPARWLLSDFSLADSTREIYVTPLYRDHAGSATAGEDAWSEKRITVAR